MFKIGYYVNNVSFVDKILSLSSFNHEYLIYELNSDDIDEIIDLKLDLIIYDFYPNEVYKLEKFEKIKEELNIKGICVLNEYSDDLIEIILKYHVRYLCDSSICAKALYVMILRILNENINRNTSIYERVDTILIKKNLPIHLKGTCYLKSCILYFKENKQGEFLMKEVYDTIAKKHHTTSSRVEKNIRSAIDMSGSSLSNYKFILECLKEI